MTPPTIPGSRPATTDQDRPDGEWRWRIGALLAVAAFGLLVLTCLRWLDAAHTVVAAIQAARPVWGVIGVAVLVGSLFTRRLSAIVLSALLVAIQLVLAVPWFIGSGTVAPREDDLVVLSSNLEFGQADPTVLAREAADLDVDVLVLLEVTPESLAAIEATDLGRQLPHRVGRADSRAAGSVVLSRYPLTEVSKGSGTFAQPLVSVATERGEVLVKAVHPMPPTSPLVWHRELTRLGTAAADLKAGDPRPFMLAGDFNASQDHPVFRPLERAAVDAHEVAGAGWVRTWPRESSVPAFTQIDHILVNGLSVVDAGSVTIPGTDHGAVWARLHLP